MRIVESREEGDDTGIERVGGNRDPFGPTISQQAWTYYFSPMGPGKICLKSLCQASPPLVALKTLIKHSLQPLKSTIIDLRG